MVLLCFVLDLQNLAPPLLQDLKQSLLQLGNFYAISSCRNDRIGLCYLQFDRVSSSRQLKIAYSPRGKFNLHDFHNAVNSLPTDDFSPYINDTTPSSHDLNLSSILSDEVLYSWGDKDIVRRQVIFITSCLDGIGNIDYATRKTLMDAADKCVSVEFTLLEQKSSHLIHLPESINDFVKNIGDIENCCFHSYLPDTQTWNGLVKQWLQELKDDMEKSLQARFIFDSNLVTSVDSVYCKLSSATSQIVDGFTPCQTCRCHGIQVDKVVGDRIKGTLTCPITGQNLGALDFIENAVKVGEHTILFLPSFHKRLKLQQITLPIVFNIIERTKLRSLSEGVIFGIPYFTSPSSCQDIEVTFDENDKSELNAQLFRGLCCALHSLDQGLLCSSNCNIETMRETDLLCYYILQPSEHGPMLLRRLAGSEEVLPHSDFSQSTESSLPKDIENSIQDSLSKIGVRDYNPVLHERGLHAKLNLLVKETLHLSSIPSKSNIAIIEANSTSPNSPEVTKLSYSELEVGYKENEICRLNHAKEDKTPGYIAEEWEQLMVTEFPKMHSPHSMSKPNLGKAFLPPPNTSNKQLDVNTSRILERLEVPKKMRIKAVLPMATSNATTEAKKPLFPHQTNHAVSSQTIKPTVGQRLIASQPMKPISGQRLIASQPMKPTFQKLKRKL